MIDELNLFYFNLNFNDIGSFRLLYWLWRVIEMVKEGRGSLSRGGYSGSWDYKVGGLRWRFIWVKE